MLEIKKFHTANFNSGRGNFAPLGFVIHVSEGSFDSTFKWCMDIKSQVSYHYLIKENGDTIELVNPANTAWHAGKVVKPTSSLVIKGSNPNSYTIGIAYAGFAKQGPTLAQFINMAALIHSLAGTYKIPLDRKYIIGHNEIRSDKVCPGPHLALDSLVYLAHLM